MKVWNCCGTLPPCKTLKPKDYRTSGLSQTKILTYKKAIRVLNQHLEAHGFSLSKTAQKQAGYLALYATEGEISKQLHHDLKAILKNLPCDFTPGSMEDATFESHVDRYGELLNRENPEGGEISLGWLITETKEQEIWKVFSGAEV
jgi:hypothetical protein